MKKMSSLILVFILLVGSQANSQVKSSATQTLTFAVNRSVQSSLKVFTDNSDLNLDSKSPEMTKFQNSLEKMFMKVTVAEISIHTAEVSPKYSDVHLDIRATTPAAKSTIGRIPKIITVTE